MEDDVALPRHGLEELVGPAYAVELDEDLPALELVEGVPLAALAVDLEDVDGPAGGVDAVEEA